MQSYDDEVRKMDYETIANRGGAPSSEMSWAAYKALAAVALSEQLRPVIEAIDPKVMEQVRRALGLSEEVSG